MPRSINRSRPQRQHEHASFGYGALVHRSRARIVGGGGQDVRSGEIAWEITAAGVFLLAMGIGTLKRSRDKPTAQKPPA